LLCCLLAAVPARADAPGGFVAPDSSTAVRPVLTPSQIQAFLPSRGPFTFPAPYGTRGVRITNASDCGGNDCVDYIGYSYWRNMNDHGGSNMMLLFVTLDRARGGGGPTLFSYDKSTDQVTSLGPLFDPSSPFSYDSGEGWYFSARRPTQLYMNAGPKMLRYDVLSRAFETVFDASSQYGPDTRIWQMHSSDDDNVHSATLVQASTGEYLGCLVYRESDAQFSFFAKLGAFDECQIDKSGRWLVIKEQTPTTCPGCDEDNVIVDLQTGVQSLLSDPLGAAGHSDLGYGYMVAADDWFPLPNAWRLWSLALDPVAGLPLGLDNLLQGELLYTGASWDVFAPQHVSFENARADTPIDQQYACGGSVNVINGPRANEIICFMLDGSGRVLVVAPVMTDPNASGGGSDYAKEPKGNLDVTGQYFLWTSNLGGDRLDAFIVKVPAQLLTGSGTPPPPPPAVIITTPGNGATVSGSVTVAASVTDVQTIASINFEIDGGKQKLTLTQPPYSTTWNTATLSSGMHVITAVAVDNSGASFVSPPVTVVVANGPPAGGGPSPRINSGSGRFNMQTALLLVVLLYLKRRRSRAGYGICIASGIPVHQVGCGPAPFRGFTRFGPRRAVD
jgi:hypothetical protein